MSYAVSSLVGVLVGILCFYLGRRSQKSRIREFENKVQTQAQKEAELERELQRKDFELEKEQSLASEKLKAFEEAQTRLEEQFRSLSAQALEKNSESFLTLAKTQLEQYQSMAQKELSQKQDNIKSLVDPVKESLLRVDEKIQKIEQSRTQSEAGLLEQIKHLGQTHHQLRQETSSLVAALRAPQSRGQWGEMQLRRVVEMAGMLSHCDFQTQSSSRTENGNLRPDMLVKLPGGKKIVVDAKTPLNAYLEASAADDPEIKKQKLLAHARHIRKHIDDLSKKAYWNQFQTSPEFVVLFLPGESFFSAALEVDPSLIEVGVEQNVIISTPTTLIALLRAVAYGWRQEQLAENVRQVGALGKELYNRLSTLGGHMSRLGKSLEQSIRSYNDTVGALESRVMVSARKMSELQMNSKQDEIAALNSIDQSARQLQSPELTPSDGA